MAMMCFAFMEVSIAVSDHLDVFSINVVGQVAHLHLAVVSHAEEEIILVVEMSNGTDRHGRLYVGLGVDAEIHGTALVFIQLDHVAVAEAFRHDHIVVQVVYDDDSLILMAIEGGDVELADLTGKLKGDGRRRDGVENGCLPLDCDQSGSLEGVVATEGVKAAFAACAKHEEAT